MKIFFDESGQTGCVVSKKNLLNFSDSPTFALGAIVVNEQDEKRLIKKSPQVRWTSCSLF